MIEALGPRLRGYFRSILPEDDAYDAYSSFAEDVWRGLPGFMWICPLRAWVYRVARHAAARLLRDGYRRRREPLEAAAGVAAPVDSTSETEGLREQLEKLRDELHPKERNLLALRIGRELEWREVSVAMVADGETLSSAALRKRFERLKNKLVVLADERGLLYERRGRGSAGNGAPLRRRGAGASRGVTGPITCIAAR